MYSYAKPTEATEWSRDYFWQLQSKMAELELIHRMRDSLERQLIRLLSYLFVTKCLAAL